MSGGAWHWTLSSGDQRLIAQCSGPFMNKHVALSNVQYVKRGAEVADLYDTATQSWL